jgi:hypothetical protein
MPISARQIGHDDWNKARKALRKLTAMAMPSRRSTGRRGTRSAVEESLRPERGTT